MTKYNSMEVAPTVIRKEKIYLKRLVDQEMLDIVSAFASVDGLDHVFTEVRSSSYQGVLPPDEDKRISNKYDGCVIHFHECIFFFIDFKLTFNDFEVGSSSHLVISHSQLHLVR